MRSTENITPAMLVNKIRENQNNNKKLKSLFASQFLGKFDVEELQALIVSIEKEISRRSQAEVDERIAYLESLGYKISK